ncbi:type I methionyl aminopeptidase [Candidatus Hepatoplasma crinochetorum]|uniref:type I methionyl aminopeptidase n=1 Tax=Candidatus Hepatoplasma crinochetorum TaxID=295596 RepID=UPI003086D4E3|nr:MAG: methionine aminopeptidase [Candidatus Hepatoplasma crinochetorum]
MSKLKTVEEIKDLEIAGKIIKDVFLQIEKKIKPGITSIELDKLAYDIIIKANAIPLFLNHEGFPNTICASPNNIVVHGIPNDNKLKEGDIITIDVGAKYNKMCVDAARTFAVGKISQEDQKLIDLTDESLNLAIKAIEPGKKIGDISNIIETFFKKFKEYSISSEYVGHFIGENLWEEPVFPNKGKKGTGLELKAGMTFCVEPIIIRGKDQLFVDPFDKWTVYTKHKGKACHIEHTILVTKKGAKIIV